MFGSKISLQIHTAGASLFFKNWLLFGLNEALHDVLVFNFVSCWVHGCNSTMENDYALFCMFPQWDSNCIVWSIITVDWVICFQLWWCYCSVRKQIFLKNKELIPQQWYSCLNERCRPRRKLLEEILEILLVQGFWDTKRSYPKTCKFKQRKLQS